MARVAWTPRALADLQGIRAYLITEAPGAADGVLRRIRQAVRRLHDHPQIGRAVPELGQPHMREVISAPYRVLYRYGGGTVEIIAIVHGARQLPPLTERD